MGSTIPCEICTTQQLGERNGLDLFRDDGASEARIIWQWET